MNRLNEIATVAHCQKKPNKAKAFNLIKSLINAGEIIDSDLAALYSYFLPAIPAKKTPEQWVFAASAKKDHRPYLNQAMYSDGSRLIATDGHRLHFIKTDLVAGFYNQNMEKLDVDWVFPDVDRVICDKYTYKDDLNIKYLPVITSDRIEAYQIQNSDVCVHLQAQYLKQAISGMIDPVIEYVDAKTNVRITDTTGKTAIIMPVRV